MRQPFSSSPGIFFCPDAVYWESLVSTFLLVNKSNILICFGGFLGFLQLGSFSAKSIDLRHACTGCTFAEPSCFGGACTWDNCAKGTCVENACIGANTCSACIRGACIGIACVRGACVSSANIVEHLEMYL